jgi:hypothetical protein
MICYYLSLATVTLQDAILGLHSTNRRLAEFLMAFSSVLISYLRILIEAGVHEGQ